MALIYVIHCMACVFELSSNLALDQRRSWEDVYLNNDPSAEDVLTKYLSALYWSVSAVSCGVCSRALPFLVEGRQPWSWRVAKSRAGHPNAGQPNAGRDVTPPCLLYTSPSPRDRG